MGGDHTAPCAQNPLQTLKHRVQEIVTATDKTSWKETIIPQAHNILHHMTFLTVSPSTIKQKRQEEETGIFNDKYNLDYYSSSDSDSESEHEYETLI